MAEILEEQQGLSQDWGDRAGRRQPAWAGKGNRHAECGLGHRESNVLNPSPETGNCLRKAVERLGKPSTDEK